MASKRLTFQSAVSQLQAFWADQGCLIWQPHNVEVGAGTMNPATFLYVLGPEPWNVAYFEPSVRPDDARYGENPNRMGRHHQLQVILKPDPGDPQGLFLESLSALGIDLSRHDVRFVEDNWESPALGAWGLGWEVWLDGLEITQFTYFQQAGSLELDPVSVELTYGLDRILMALQDVRHFRELEWNERVRGSQVQLPMEVQTSRYYYELADVSRLRALYDLCEAESRHAVDAGLVFVAHDYLLKCSHMFNVLDARGAIGVTERARYFGRMRRLARDIAQAHLASREELGYPLLDEDRPWLAGGDDAPQESDESPNAQPEELPKPRDFLLEVGTEELPVDDLAAALRQLEKRVDPLLEELRLEHGPTSVYGTPRRLAVVIEALAPRQADVESQVVGPPVTAAFDDSGAPTRAAEGFARSAGVEVGELEVVERGGQERVAAVKREVGKTAIEALSPALSDLVTRLAFERSMRWDHSGQSFARPVRWIVALHGETIAPMRFAGLDSGRKTRGLRSARAPELKLAAAEDYRKLMRTHGVEVDPAARRAAIQQQVSALAEEVGGRVPHDPALLDEVTNLVEQPLAIRGEFGEEYLELPQDVLVTVMKKHQRYFPVFDDAHGLRPYFITVANGANLDAAAVRHGNEAVVRARFADAAYFWRRDSEQPLEEFTPRLETLTFQSDLGSVLDKVHRLEGLVPLLAGRLGLSERDAATASRAASLAKSDLATEMVVDFTSLQGVMGREYALQSGEPPEVAEAIAEQYLPRGAGDDVPHSAAGSVLALADRLDSLVGLFAVGAKPTGAADPYGLRRAALGVISILIGREKALDLGGAIDDAAKLQPVTVDAEAKEEVARFLRRRLEGQLRDAGHEADVVAAVLAVQGADPHAAATGVRDLERHIARPDWQTTLDAYARCARLVRGQDEGHGEVDPEQFERPAETVLRDAFAAATQELDLRDLNAVLHALAALAPAIHTYFDEVLVMDEDAALRQNRLSQVRQVADLTAFVADMSELEGF